MEMIVAARIGRMRLRELQFVGDIFSRRQYGAMGSVYARERREDGQGMGEVKSKPRDLGGDRGYRVALPCG
jgi:hypothetical protein